MNSKTNINPLARMPRNCLPTDIVFTPSWWFKNTGITFDKDFFFHPARRVEDERRMEKELYERWGRFGLGEDRKKNRPEIGAVHLAAGYLVSEMLGCKVEYSEAAPPTVSPLNIESLSELSFDNAFKSPSFKLFINMKEKLKAKYGYISGDINWSGILNIALDLRGQEIFMDMFDYEDDVERFFAQIAEILEKFATGISSETGSSSISVNRTVKHFDKQIFLHSECSNTMISIENYETFLLPYDIAWSKLNRPFGIHYCGKDPHRYAEAFAKIPNLDFLDLGWGGDVKELRRYLPNTFFNIRLSPVEIEDQSNDEIRQTIKRLVFDSANPQLTGLCCINMDERVSDEKIDTIFETVDELRMDTNIL